jgi:hypothetical protein
MGDASLPTAGKPDELLQLVDRVRAELGPDHEMRGHFAAELSWLTRRRTIWKTSNAPGTRVNATMSRGFSRVIHAFADGPLEV